MKFSTVCLSIPLLFWPAPAAAESDCSLFPKFMVGRPPPCLGSLWSLQGNTPCASAPSSGIKALNKIRGSLTSPWKCGIPEKFWRGRGRWGREAVGVRWAWGLPHLLLPTSVLSFKAPVKPSSTNLPQFCFLSMRVSYVQPSMISFGLQLGASAPVLPTIHSSSLVGRNFFESLNLQFPAQCWWEEKKKSLNVLLLSKPNSVYPSSHFSFDSSEHRKLLYFLLWEKY